MAAYSWEFFVDYLDGTRPITKAERDELWTAFAALLARCGGRWKLVTADMDAIKASRLATDKTSVENDDDEDFIIADLARVLIDIEDTFTGTRGLDAFKAVCPAEGISEDDLAELIVDAGRITPIDTFHLWNLYKRVLDYLSCCPTTLPGLEWDSVSASEAKCGDPEFGTPSSPPKIYRETVGSGSVSASVTGTDCPEETATTTWTLSQTRNNCTGVMTPSYSDINQWCVWSVAHLPISNCQAWYDSEGPLCNFAFPDVISKTQAQMTAGDIAGGGCCNDPVTIFSGGRELTITLTDEYLTSTMLADLMAALVTFPGSWAGTPGSYFYLAPDERDADARKSRARLPLAGVTLAIGATYRIYYNPSFTPVGGDNELGDETYVEFTYADGMEYVDFGEVELPSENGTNDIVNLRIECAPFVE